MINTDDVYGMCIHGENMTTCGICNNFDGYYYTIENKKTKQFVGQKNGECFLTKTKSRAMKFDGKSGKSIANIIMDVLFKECKIIKHKNSD